MKRMRRITLFLVLGVAAFTTAGALLFYFDYWKYRQQLASLEWVDAASPADIREASHRVLSWPLGDTHDAPLYLSEVGNIESVPILIRAMRWHVALGVDVQSCEVLGIEPALQSLTGFKGDHDYRKWEAWWSSVGSSLPPEHFHGRRLGVGASKSR